MNKPWENDTCENIYSYMSIYPVAVAAALWCGIPHNLVDQYLKEAATPHPAVFKHPKVPCLEPKCSLIHRAIVSGALPVSREDGCITTDHVAPGRRHISRQHLKEWISKELPSDKPAFLFDEIERNTHPAINANSFRALQADRDATQTEIAKMKVIISKITQERDSLLDENNSLKSMVENYSAPTIRAETTYLNIIGGLLELMLGKTPTGSPRSAFTNQTAIINVLLAEYKDKQGIAKRTLEEKFSAAKQSLEST